MDAKNIAKLMSYMGRTDALTADERAEYTALIGETQSLAHSAQATASKQGIKVASREQQAMMADAVNILVYNVECQARYSLNVVCGNAVAALNTIALQLGIPTHDSAMQWYTALNNMPGTVRAVVEQGITTARARNHWSKALAEYAVKHGEPINAPVNLTDFAGLPAK